MEQQSREGTRASRRRGIIQPARVLENQPVCRAHYRLRLRLRRLPSARPGQFVHISPQPGRARVYRAFDWQSDRVSDEWLRDLRSPMLRRAFSIAGIDRTGDGVSIDVVYRVVGRATLWMESLWRNERVSVLGPLGNGFPIHNSKPVAWLVAGGVGLPPMFWLARSLHEAHKRTVAFCGARTADLLALTWDRNTPVTADASRPTAASIEFAASGTPVVISTDDGSLGYGGHVGAALAAYHRAQPTAPEEVVVYACGPERMMQFVAAYCVARGIECYACMERSMACGTGMCQSCVVALHDGSDAEGWRYQLCCEDGPVFDARRIAWEPTDGG